MTSYFNLNIVRCRFVTSHKDLIKPPLEVGALHPDRWRVSVGVCAGGVKVCVKEVPSKGSWRQGCGLSGESSVKIPLGETHTCHSVFRRFLWPDFCAALHERDWCTSQRGQCAVRLSVSGRLSSAPQLPLCVCVFVCHPNNTVGSNVSSKCFIYYFVLALCLI